MGNVCCILVKSSQLILNILPKKSSLHISVPPEKISPPLT